MRPEITDYVSSGVVSENIAKWPGNGDVSKGQAQFMAPFFDADGDGIYNTASGDYPTLDPNELGAKPDQMIWWVYNDKGHIHSETQGQAIGVEVQTTAFAFSTNDEVNNMTFYGSKIINRGFTTLKDCYMGQWVDADLGNYADDYVGCDVGRGLGFCYNGDDDDEGVLGYGLNPPTIGVDYFEGPTDSAGNQMGLSHYMYYNNDSDPVRGNPGEAIEYYNLLQGKWLGGQNVTYGGTGFGGSKPAKYMFPGDTDPAYPTDPWTEKSDP